MMADVRLNFRSFEQVLQDPKMYLNFKQYCVRDFSVEQVFFYEKHKELMQKTRSELGLSERPSVRKSPTNEPLLQENTSGTDIMNATGFMKVPSTLSRDLLQSYTLVEDPRIQIPENMLPDYLNLYNQFIDEFAPFEINLSGTVRDKLRKVFGGLDLEMAAEGSTGNKRILSAKPISITVFDEARREVVNAM
ncbi:hypothetical protein HK102_002364, partial [Quaeritorhiza haematococci]